MSNNTQQDQFIKTFGTNILLSASAGSGKTYTMIQKLMYILSSTDPDIHADINNIMVVTFTKNAAGEMKQRLVAELLDRGASSDEIDRVGASDIGTIDSIGNKLVSKYFYALGLRQGTTIVDPSEQQYLYYNAIERVLDEYNRGDDPDYVKLYEYFEKKRSSSNLVDAIVKLNDFLNTKVDPEQYEARLLERILQPYDKSEYVAFVYECIKEKFSTFAERIERVQRSCIDKGMLKDSALCGAMIEVCEGIANCKSMADMASGVFDAVIPQVSDDDYETDQELHGVVEQYATVFADKLAKYAALIETKRDYDNYQPLYVDIVKKLFEVVSKIRDRYAKSKETRGLVDFVDIEQYTAKLLTISEIRDDIADNYKYIFVDEYQDFTECQEYIVTRISNGKNLFMIGDVKQSIYGFRNCTPQIFLKKESDYSFNNGGVCNNLNLNYRSGTNILEFVNFIFDRVMNKDNCGIEYASNCDLICDPDGVQNDNHAPIKLDIFNKASRDFPNVDLQSGKIVEYIRGILGTDRLDYKTRTNKKIDYRDIAILLRNRTNALNIYYTLKKSGIPVKIDFKIDLFACYEVQMLVDILKCVANDKDDIALTSFLAGPLCKFSSNELAMIKQGSEGDNFYTRVTNYTGDKDIEAKIANAYSILRDLRQKLQEGNVVNMLNYMIDRYDLENILRASDKDGSRITNVKKFLSILNSSDNSNIYRTLALIELLQSGDGVDVTLSDDSNAVTIMTMHKSKGLEWPVVIIPFLEVKPKEDQMESIIVQDDFGVGINYRDIDSRRLQRSIFFNATKLAKFEEEYAERIRLLYVALTRAKNHLYMIGCMDMSKIDRQLSPLEDEYDNYLSMILGCIKDSKEYTSLKVTGSASVKLFGGYQFDISVQEPKFKEEEESAKADISVSEDMMDKIRTYQNFTYPYMDDTDIAIKNTVTSILKESDDYTMLTDAPRKLHTSDMAHGASANEYGTAYHRVLEYALTHPDVDIATVLDMLLKDNKISLDVRNMLDIDNIEHSKRDILSKIANRKYVCEAQFMMKVPHKDIISGSGTESKILVQGVCDLVIFGAGEITLVDYKTNRRDLDSIADMYAVQLGIYAKALELRYGVPVKKLIYSTYSNAWVEV